MGFISLEKRGKELSVYMHPVCGGKVNYIVVFYIRYEDGKSRMFRACIQVLFEINYWVCTLLYKYTHI